MAKRDSKLPQQSADNRLIDADGELRQPIGVPDDMPGTYDKKQHRFRPRSPELHFTTSIYIDRAAELLRTQAEKVYDRQDLLIVQCDIMSVDSDRARFRLESLRMGKTTGRLEGTMQRWQGNLTRVDVNVQYFTYNDDERWTTQLIVGELVVGIVGALGVQVLLMKVFGVSFEKSAIPVWVLAAVVVFIGIKNALIPGPRITHVMAKRDITELTTILTSTFSEHDLQWINQ
jgi:hypothetical protein